MENTSDFVPINASATEEPFQVYRYYFMRQIFAGVCLTAAIIGVIGNCLVIAAVPLSKKLRTVTNVFVVSLSVSDLLSSLALPWQSLAVLSEEGWPYPSVYGLCVAISAMLLLGNACSVTTLALIAINRWIGITKSAATTRRVYTRRNLILMVAFSWVFPIATVILPPLLGFGELGYEPKYSLCSWIKDRPYSYVQDIVGTLCFFPVQFTTIACCYVSIFRYVRKTSRRMVSHDTKTVSGAVSSADKAMRKQIWRRQVAVTKNLVYIVLAYIVCLTPFFIVLITGENTIPVYHEWIIQMTPFAGLIIYCNCCLNPIIYATSHPDFKEVFSYMLRCKYKDIPQSRAQARQIKMEAKR